MQHSVVFLFSHARHSTKYFKKLSIKMVMAPRRGGRNSVNVSLTIKKADQHGFELWLANISGTQTPKSRHRNGTFQKIGIIFKRLQNVNAPVRPHVLLVPHEVPGIKVWADFFHPNSLVKKFDERWCNSSSTLH